MVLKQSSCGVFVVDVEDDKNNFLSLLLLLLLLLVPLLQPLASLVLTFVDEFCVE
jgi:hypothetical protein